MKRRTNLFYSSDIDDSNFLTFSNYTEHLTGVALSAEYKLFPSRFLCFHIPSLNDKDKREFFIKQYLAGYYENKLTVCRDIIVNNSDNEYDNNHPDFYLKYLGFLIETFKKYVEDQGDTLELLYESSITEQDYNGTFTDIICTIDSGEALSYKYSINLLKNTSNTSISLSKDEGTSYIYGWSSKLTQKNEYKWFGPSNYELIEPIYDDNNYNYNLNCNIYLSKSSEISNSEDMTFNIIVPLYDIVNINIDTNDTDLSEDTPNIFDEDGLNIAIKNRDEHIINVPYGIWFAKEDITLKRDTKSGYSPSWSLLIGTQFKPFPNSPYLYEDTYEGGNMAGFATFAQVLARQNEVYEKLEDSYKTITQLKSELDGKNDRITYLETQFQNLSDLIDGLVEKINNSNAEQIPHVWKIVNKN
jgi:hypothetical protein